jgi:hypothetical protein
MTHAQHYLALLPSFGRPATEDQRLHLEMLHFFDDRRWPVHVWYHDRLPAWIRKNRILSQALYGFRLLWTPASTVIVDSSLFSFCGLNLLWVGFLTSHRILISLCHASQPDFRPLSRFCLNRADLILVDSKEFFMEMVRVGVSARKIRILPRTHFIPLRHDMLGAFHPPLRTVTWKKVRKKFGNMIQALAR